MPIIELTAPSFEPVTIDEAKNHLRVIGNEEATYIKQLIKVARGVIETKTQRALCRRTFRLVLDDWPLSRVIELPYPPLASVETVKYLDAADALQTFSNTYYKVDTEAKPGRIIIKWAEVWPSWPIISQNGNAVQIDYTAGYETAAGIEPELKQAVLIVLAQYFVNREPIAYGPAPAEVPGLVDMLVAPYRIW